MEIHFATEDSALVGTAVADEDGWYTLPVYGTEMSGHVLRLQAEGQGFTTGYAWVELNFRDMESALVQSHPNQTWSTWEYMLPPLRMAGDFSQGRVTGEIVDAVTGEPVGGVVFSVLEGWNAPSDATVEKEVTTGTASTEGEFEIDDLPPGMYTAWVPAFTGYTESRFPLYIGGEVDTFTRAAVSEPIPTDEIRGVLLWGDSPADVNLHLTGPRASAEDGNAEWERWHVWLDNPVHPSNADEDKDTVVEILRDDDDGGGPETIHVYETRSTGDYRFSAFDSSNAASSDSTALSSSGARVQLWVGAEEPAFFEIIPGRQGNRWQACAYDASTGLFHDLQEMATVAEESNDLEF